MSEVILALAGVSKRFDGVQALAGVGLALRSGEVRALVGANGSGKSTLLKLLTRVMYPFAGSVATAGRVGERTFASLSKGRRRS